jgi:aryl-alcohol dehydrogenase-like predicted oxidoreductase/Pyruvate/2-oxoacid:ferredoxin oxidoreductase delta subunit
MKYIRLGKTNLTVSKTAIGTVPLQRLPTPEAVRLIRAAYDGGVTFFDTADNYSQSEAKLGRALEGLRHKVVIATKVSVPQYSNAMVALEQSMRDLKTDYIDVIQLHNPKEVPDGTAQDDALAALYDAQKKGYVRHIGFTSHSLRNALAAAKSGLFDTIQYPLCYLSSSKDDELIEYCMKENLGLIAMKPFAGGMIRDAALTFLYFRQKENVVPIYGIQRRSELEVLLELEENPPQLDSYMAISIQEGKKRYQHLFCRGCEQCLPACPQGIRPGYMGRIGDFLYRNPPGKYLTQAWHEQVSKIPSCTGCGKCVAACPFDCDLREKMKESYLVFSDFWSRKEDFGV